MGLAVARRTVLVDQVIGELERQVHSGSWALGERVPSETQLAKELGVGRSTVREAVRALISSGLLESRQGAGTFVRARVPRSADLSARLRRAGVLEVYEVRHGLELLAARLAAARRTDDDLLRLEAALTRRRRARSAGRIKAFVDADLDFHRGVIAAAHNPVLTDLFDTFLDVLRGALLDLAGDPVLRQDTHPQHVALAEAIRRGDQEAAAAATADHLHSTQERLSRLLERFP